MPHVKTTQFDKKSINFAVRLCGTADLTISELEIVCFSQFESRKAYTVLEWFKIRVFCM